MPELLCTTTSRKKVQDIVVTSLVIRTNYIVLIHRRHRFQHARLTHDAQAREQYESNASQFTIRSLMMTGPAHIFALCVSVHLPEQPSGFSSGLPRDQTLPGVFFEHCPDRRNLLLCLLLLSRFLTLDRFVQLLVIVLHGFQFCSPDTLQ